MAKAVLRFRSDVHGFDFVNRFDFDARERAVLSGIGASVSAALAGVLPPLPGVHIAVPIAVASYLNLGPLPPYGLCGGMAYAAADHWRARATLPRGNGSEPLRRGAGAPVRAMLWDRLLQSLTVGGVLMRTLHWMLLLNLVPEFAGGGALNLRNLSTDEYRALKSRIDLGSPVPIGLVGTTLAAWDQHQVLVYGYEDVGATGARLHLYDPNAPRAYGNLLPNIAEVDFGAHDLSFTWPSMNPSIGTVKGFFCSNYGFTAPDPTLARSFGLFQLPAFGPLVGALFMVTDGAKFPVAGGFRELRALGASPFDMVTAGSSLDEMALTTMRVPVDPADPTGPQQDVPDFRSPADDTRLLMDGTLLRDRSSRTTFLSGGGAMFAADAAAIAFFGGPAAVRIVPAGSLRRFPSGPQQGQMLRELSSATIWLIDQGTKREMTPYADFAAHGGRDAIRIVPDGTLSAWPTGARLPQPAPGECQRLKTQEAALVADLARADEVVANASTPRAEAAARAARLRIQQALAQVRGRRQVLGCP